MKASPQTNEIFAALAKVTGQLKNPKKSATAKAGSYSYGYAPLDQIVEDTRAALADQGMACFQELLTDDYGRVGCTTFLTHASGQWLEMGPFWLPGGEGAQQKGSAATYARRYALSAALLLAAEDDDDAATVKQKRTRQRGVDVTVPGVDLTETSGEGHGVPAPFPSPDPSPDAGHGLDGVGSEEAGGAEAGEGTGEKSRTPSSAPPVDDEPWDELVERQQAMHLLLSVTDGNLNKAVTLVNRLHKTSFTKNTLDQATAEQLYAAAELGEEKSVG